jgi:hypothetical protein
MKRKSFRHRNNRSDTSKKKRTLRSVAATDQAKRPILLSESGESREVPNRKQMSEMLFQRRLESHRLELRRGNLFDFLEVLNSAIDHAGREKDVSCRLPQWFLLYLSELLEQTFLAPQPPGWLGKVRKRFRQHLLDLTRFQAVVNLRCEGHSVDEAYDLASEALRSQGYDGGEQAVRWSYRRILRGIRDVEAAMGEPGVVDGQDQKSVEGELTGRSAGISDATSKAITALRRRAQLDNIGSKRTRPEIEAPPNMELSVAEALLLANKVIPGAEYLKRTPSEKDGLVANLVNRGDLAKAAMQFAVDNRDVRGVIAFGLTPGTACKVDAQMRPIERGMFFFVDRGLAFGYNSYK